MLFTHCCRHHRYHAGRSIKDVALLNYLENFSLLCCPWVLQTVTIKTINKKALIITEKFDQQNVKKTRWEEYVIRVSYNLNDSFQQNKYHLIQSTLVVLCLKVAFLGTVHSSLVLLVSAKTRYHQLSSCASYGMGHRELR